MTTGLEHIGPILMVGLRMTPEERAAAKKAADRQLAESSRAEMAKYNALNFTERAEYDALTLGMMPRLARDLGDRDPRGGR